jgi:MoaA/NifB/PqqE/SkfB family radical SAM enzyme
MKLDDIGFYTLSDNRAKYSNVYSPLWRCELILTNRCNFNCPYCRGVKNDISGDIQLGDAINIINYWSNQNLKNIRFSGGEPTLCEHLTYLVRYSKREGIERIAISTNGSRDYDYYETLVDAGVNDFSISLDACCSSTGSIMSGREEKMFDIISESIFKLSKITYVTVGVVVTDSNIGELNKIIEYADSLGVSDIRVISAAQNNVMIDAFASINENVLMKYPILNYRANNYKNGRDIRGIKGSDCNKCYLVLDDMAVAKNKHFPCIIYLREKGDDIGRFNGFIRRDRCNWFVNHDSYKDDICRNNCLDVCVDYNNKCRELKGI